MDLATWIERWAGFFPNKTAIRFDGDERGYGAMAARVRRIAAAIRARGIGVGDRVASLSLNRPEMLELGFACARVGAIFQPLNWRLAAPEIGYIVGHAEPKLIVVEDEFAPLLAGTTAPRIHYGAAFEALAASPGEGLTESVYGPGASWLLVYTSGTTGKPKGALLTQEAILFTAINGKAAFDLAATDHALTVLPMFHVGGLNIQTLPALHAGATVTLHRRFEPGPMLKTIGADRPSVTLLVPAVMSALIAHPDWKRADLSSLRVAGAGSSSIPEALIRAFHDRGVPIVQVYGSTETGPTAIHQRIETAFATVGAAGRPALHCDARIVDDDGKPLPRGVKGEIEVRGPNVLKEYWRDPEASEAVFRDGWYRTGDVGHIDAGGDFWVDDRKKDMIISGGENIYPAELENVLADCPSIAEAAVVGRPDAKWGEVPVAVVVKARGAALDERAVLALFEGRLARFKHPRAVVFVESLPRNVMGKVLKYELRDRI